MTNVRQLDLRGHALRIEIEESTPRVFHDGAPVALQVTGPGRMTLRLVENGRPVSYDIQLLESVETRNFVGRNGRVIDSDAPAFLIDRTGEIDP